MNVAEKKLLRRPSGWWHVVLAKDGTEGLNVRCRCLRMLRAVPGGLVTHCGVEYKAPASLEGLPVRTSWRIARKRTAHQKFLEEHGFDLTERKWRQRMRELADESTRDSTIQASA
jgi:hypothetical protein